MVRLPNISQTAFWDIDTNKLDYINHKDYIINKIFNYGRWDDILSIIRFYGMNDVKQSLIEAENMSETALQLASIIFKIPKTHFTCYTLKQYRPSFKKP